MKIPAAHETYPMIWLYLSIFIGFMLILPPSCRKFDDENFAFTDIDGNVYHMVTIGSQIWMRKNLKVIHYRNGDPIGYITNASQWTKQATGAYCDYVNDEKNVSTYGRLYNRKAVKNNHKICPFGWHVPSDNEWTILTNFLGGSDIAGGKMKEGGTTHWHVPNRGATNESGFTALPAGNRCPVYTTGMQFIDMGEKGIWWSSSLFNSLLPIIRSVEAESTNIWGGSGGISNDNLGLSVRCIKDGI